MSRILSILRMLLSRVPRPRQIINKNLHACPPVAKKKEKQKFKVFKVNDEGRSSY